MQTHSLYHGGIWSKVSAEKAKYMLLGQAPFYILRALLFEVLVIGTIEYSRSGCSILIIEYLRVSSCGVLDFLCEKL